MPSPFNWSDLSQRQLSPGSPSLATAAPLRPQVIREFQPRAHMVEKFNPAPLDKHPEDPKEAAKADREMDGNFMAGLVGTFPASDPVSATQPGTRTGSPNPLWIR